MGATECVGKDYLSIMEALNAAGFQNILFEKIEDIKVSETERVGNVEAVSVDGNAVFEKGQEYDSFVEVVIKYHTYEKCAVKVHVNFVSNLLLNRDDVEINMVDIVNETIPHGEDADIEFSIEPGKYTIAFTSKEDSNIKGEVLLDVKGNTNVSYKIACYSDEIAVETEYVENLDAVGENEVMLAAVASDYKFKDYKEVEAALKGLGFTNISMEVLYDIALGLTEEGTTEVVSEENIIPEEETIEQNMPNLTRENCPEVGRNVKEQG